MLASLLLSLEEPTRCASISLFPSPCPLHAQRARHCADVKLPAVFGDHMVLQRDAKVPVWGWAEPNEQVTVTAGEAKANAPPAPMESGRRAWKA